MIFKLLGAALGLVLLVIVGRLLYLLPAHLEVRTVRPALPDLAQFEALLAAPDRPVSVSAILTSSQRSPVLSLGHHSIVIEWADGRILLIDVGMDEATAVQFGALMKTIYGADPVEVHTTTFAALGERVADVAAVGFTHLHIDHTQGIAAACAGDPEFVIVQTVQQRDLHNSNTTEGASIVESCPRHEVVQAETLVELPDFPGVAMYSLGGHTPGSTLFAVAYQQQVLLFSGDITNSRRDLSDDNGKGFAYSYLLVPEDTQRTSALRAWLRRLDRADNIRVLVSHDLDDMRALNQLGSTPKP